jgi:hypothetical protein
VVGDIASQIVDAVHLYDEVRESGHETLCGLGDRVAANGGNSIVDPEGPIFLEE